MASRRELGCHCVVENDLLAQTLRALNVTDGQCPETGQSLGDQHREELNALQLASHSCIRCVSVFFHPHKCCAAVHVNGHLRDGLHSGSGRSLLARHSSLLQYAYQQWLVPQEEQFSYRDWNCLVLGQMPKQKC